MRAERDIAGELDGGPEPRPWFPAPALQATAALHVAGAAALAVPGVRWPWVAGALIANHSVLFAGCLIPRSRLLGPNVVRLPEPARRRREVTLTFDDGPNPEVTPRVLDMLDRHGARGSFFCIGANAAAHPELAREIAARGHSVESHSQTHSLGFGWYGPRRLRRELGSAQAAIADAAGVAPRFFRAPFGVRNPMLDHQLARFGLTYVSWGRRGYDAVDPDAPRVLRRLTRRLEPGDLFLLHDGRPVGGQPREATVLQVLPALLERLDAAGLRSVSLRAAFDLAPVG